MGQNPVNRYIPIQLNHYRSNNGSINCPKGVTSRGTCHAVPDDLSFASTINIIKIVTCPRSPDFLWC